MSTVHKCFGWGGGGGDAQWNERLLSLYRINMFINSNLCHYLFWNFVLCGIRYDREWVATLLLDRNILNLNVLLSWRGGAWGIALQVRSRIQTMLHMMKGLNIRCNKAR